MATNQMIAIWGSPSSGKTVTSIKLANELTKRKKNVILVLCGATTPAMPTVLKTKDTPDGSLGAVLSAPALTQELVLKNCVPFGKNPYLCLFGYRMGENVFSYAEYSQERAVDTLVLLRHITNYVIVDCSSVLTGDVLSTAALEVSDTALRLCSCNLKAISFFASALPLIADRKFKPDRQIRVLSGTKVCPDGGGYEDAFGGVKYHLPYLPAIEEQSASLSLLEPLTGKREKRYEQEINTIAKEVFGVGDK